MAHKGATPTRTCKGKYYNLALSMIARTCIICMHGGMYLNACLLSCILYIVVTQGRWKEVLFGGGEQILFAREACMKNLGPFPLSEVQRSLVGTNAVLNRKFNDGKHAQ